VEIWSQQYVHQFYDGKFDWMQANMVDVSDEEDGTLDVTGIDFNLLQATRYQAG